MAVQGEKTRQSLKEEIAVQPKNKRVYVECY